MRTRTEPITAELAEHQASLATGNPDEQAVAYLRRIAMLHAAYSFRLYACATEKERTKHLLVYARTNGATAQPTAWDETDIDWEIQEMTDNPGHLRACLTYAAAEQRIRRTAKRRALVPAQFLEHLTPEASLLLTPPMVAEIMELFSTTSAHTTNAVSLVARHVYRLHTDSIYDLGDVVEAHRLLYGAVRVLTASGLEVTDLRLGRSPYASTITARTPAGRAVTLHQEKFYCEGQWVSALDDLREEMTRGRFHDAGLSVRAGIAQAVARLQLERLTGDEQAVGAMFRGGRVNRAGVVRVIVTVGDRGPTLKVTPDGEIHESVYDSDPAIGAAFLEAAARQAGVDPVAARAFLLETAEAIRADADVTALLELEPAEA